MNTFMTCVHVCVLACMAVRRPLHLAAPRREYTVDVPPPPVPRRHRPLPADRCRETWPLHLHQTTTRLCLLLTLALQASQLCCQVYTWPLAVMYFPSNTSRGVYPPNTLEQVPPSTSPSPSPLPSLPMPSP